MLGADRVCFTHILKQLFSTTKTFKIKSFRIITLAFAAIMLSGVCDMEAAAQSRRKTSTTKTTRTATRKSTAPTGTLATFKDTDSKSEIRLMSNGKVASSNPNIHGTWKEIKGHRSPDKIYEVRFGDQRYDGTSVYMICNEEAYLIGGGSECETEIVPGTFDRGFVTINSCDEDLDINLDEINSIPVKWLKK